MIRKRHWLHSKLVVALLLLSVLVGATSLTIWVKLRVESAKHQRRAVAEIEALGGEVWYDYQKVETTGRHRHTFHSDPKAPPPGPAWLRRLIGAEYFQEVAYVTARETKVSDADLLVLRKLPCLEGVDLAKTAISDAGMKHLEGLNLKSLCLNDTQVTGRGLRHLKEMKSLVILGLWNTDVDDSGLAHLAGLTNLASLVLDGTKTTDAGVSHLRRLTELEEWLGLVDTEVTDASLETLARFSKLRSLNLRRTKVTSAGIKSLRRSLPNTDISHGR